MRNVFVLFCNGAPVSAYLEEEAAHCAILGLPSTLDPYLCIVALPVNAELLTDGDGVTAATAGARRFSGAAGAAPVTLSTNGNKKE